jgi:uncharacterized membrane protein
MRPSKNGSDPLAFSLGTHCFALAAIGCGLRQAITGEFVRLVPKLPPWVPAQTTWARLLGGLLLAAGVAILIPRARRVGAATVAALIGVAILLLHVPNVVARPELGFVWTNPLKALTLLGGALLLAMWPQRLAERIAIGALAAFLLLAGVQHFVYADFVHQLIPGWMPGGSAWTYVTGVALLAGGLGILVPWTRRAAGRATALMILLWVVVLHLPRALANLRDVGETSGVFEALATGGIALLVSTLRSSIVDSPRSPR